MESSVREKLAAVDAGDHTERLLPTPGVKPGPTVKAKTALERLLPSTKKRRLVDRRFTSLLDQTGRMRRNVTAAEIQNWKSTIKAKSGTNPDEVAQQRLWLAEMEMRQIESPQSAQKSFEALADFVKPDHPIYGMSRFGRAWSLFFQGRYAMSARSADELLASDAVGYNRSYCALLVRHAQACAGYHAERADAGITEPTHLDPLCGVAAMAVARRFAGQSYDKEFMKSRVRYTGMGSSFDDILKAAPKLGFSAYVLKADDVGLRATFALNGGIPMVAQVEHDHFVAVTGANKDGVTYWCSDCGPWPGGEKKLTWDQWRLMEADMFVALAKPRSTYDQALQVLAKKPTVPLGQLSRIVGALTAAGVSIVIDPWRLACGIQPQSLHCFPKNIQPLCVYDESCPPSSSPMSGDPVNLATLTEDYVPARSLSIYNPTGPSVVWGHQYHSLSQVVPNGFGMGWSHPYLYCIDVPQYTPGTALGTAGYGYFNFPSTARLAFSLSSAFVPPNGTTSTSELMTMENGADFNLHWKKDGSGSPDYFVATLRNRTTIEFEKISGVSTGYARILFFPTKITDPVGNYITLQWDDRVFDVENMFWEKLTEECASLETIKNAAGTTILTLHYDNDNHLTQAEDWYGRSVYYQYDTFPVGNPPSPPNAEYPVQSDELVRVSQVVTSPTSPPARYIYDYTNYPNGEPGNGGDQTVAFLHTIEVPSPSGSSTMAKATLYYDSDGFVSSIEDAYGNRRVYVQGTSGDNTAATKVEIYAPEAETPTYRYAVKFDSHMNQTEYIFDDHIDDTLSPPAADRWAVKRTYDSSSPFRPATVLVRYGSGTAYRTWEYDWSPHGQLLSVEAPRKLPESSNLMRSTTTIEYDPDISGANPQDPLALPVSVQTSYRSEGGSTITLPATTYEYDAYGRVETVTGVKPGEVSTPSTQGDTQTSVSYTYTALGNIETITSVGSTGTRLWEFGYTSDGGFSQSEKLGQPLTVTDPAENVTAHMRYDARGNMISIQDALGNMTEANYNTQDDLTSVELPATGQSGGGQTTQTYTYRYTNGPLIQVKTYGEAGGSALRTVDYTLGEDGEVLAITGDTENVATTYDCAYKPLTFTDGASRTTTYEYYATGLPKTVYFPGWTSGNPDRILYNSYTRFGAPESITDGRGETITYSYDDEELQCTLVDFSSTNDQNITLDYDNLGRTLTVEDLSGSVEWSYDDLGNPLVQSRAFDTYSAKDVEYSYYPDGSREEMSAAIGGTNYVWHYTYDERGFCTQMTSPAGTANYAYLDNGALASREILNTSSAAVSYSAYTYNEVGMLETLTNKASSGGSTRSSYDLSASNSYDGVFNMKACAATITGLSSLSGTIGWTHDARERLTDEAVTSGSRSSGTVTGTNAYDGASNPTTLRGTSSISYNSNNQRSVSTGTWEYDGNGNPTKFRGRDCTYDLPGRMGTMRDGNNWSIGYKYGADGLMASRAKTVYIPSRDGQWTPITNAPTYYLHDGGEPVFELAIGSNFTTVSAINVRGPDGLIARKQGSNWIYYEFDQQGNVAQRRDSSGNLLTSSLYDAYGAETNNGGTPTDCFGYNAQWGYWLDRDTGLYLCQARWYDPVTARWVTRDPIGYAGGANLYGYCGGGPAGSADPSGLTVFSGSEFDVTKYNGLPKGVSMGMLLAPYRVDRDGQIIFGAIEVGANGRIDIPSRTFHMDYPHGKPGYASNRPHFDSDVLGMSHEPVGECGLLLGKAKLWKGLGHAGTVVGLGLDAYTIANSDNPAAEAVKSATVWGGAAVGAAIGSSLFPGPGTILGGIIGAAVTGLIVYWE